MVLVGTVTENTKTLIPNAEHKNFVESNEVVPAGEQVEGIIQMIEGKRRGERFVYRVFVTKEGKILHETKIKNIMPKTEVMLGADQSTTPTTVNLKPAEYFSKVKITGVLVGGIAGFAYAKYKKHDLRKSAMFIAIGAVAGYVASYVVDQNRNITVKKSK